MQPLEQPIVKIGQLAVRFPVEEMASGAVVRGARASNLFGFNVREE